MILTLGSRSEQVRLLQLALVELGFMHKADVDGIFGKKTEACVRAYQREHGLVVDGIAGPKTLAAIASASTSLAPSSPTVEQSGGLVLPIERCWPLRALADGRVPRVTSRHTIHNPSRPNHYGADLFFEYRSSDPPMKNGDHGRAGGWWIPPGTLAVAAAAGVVELAGATSTGYRVWIRHEGGLATGYFHLRDVRVLQGQRVLLGQPLGEVGDNPRDNDALHLHAELYSGTFGSYPRGTLDPEIWWRGAKVLPAAP